MPTLRELMAKKAAAGKPAAAASGGIKITPESEAAARAADIKRTLDASAPKLPPPLPHTNDRELGATTLGERLPMDHPAQDAPPEEWAWFRSLHSFETDLGIVVDQSGETAWLAVQANPFAAPVLIHKFRLINRPLAGNPY